MVSRSPYRWTLMLLVAGTPLFAQPAPSRIQEARALWSTGREFLEDSRFADAASAFERSLALMERPSTLYNLGLAYRGMNRCRQATTTFERYLSLTSDPNELRDARQMLGEVRGCVAHVTVQADGDGAEVLVDGERITVTEGRALDLDPGRHTFESQRRGYRPVRQERDVARGERVTITLAAGGVALPATIVVETGRPEAVVRIDDEVLAPGRTSVETTAGIHRVVVTYPGEEAQRRSVESAPGSRVVVSFSERTGGIATRWWFWTGVGVVVAGLVVGGVVLFSSDGEPYPATWGTAMAAIRF